MDMESGSGAAAEAVAIPTDQSNFVNSIFNFFRTILNVINYVIEQLGEQFNIDHFQFAFILVLLGAFFMVLPVFTQAEMRQRGSSSSRSSGSRPHSRK